MKKVLFLALLVGLFSTVKSQDTIVSYFDSDWKLTEKSNAHFYRNAFKNQNKTWSVKDFYINGSIQMVGSYKSKSLNKKHGYFEYYYKNGNIKNAGNYAMGKRDGEWKWYRKDGSVSSVETYNKNKLVNLSYYNEDGSIAPGEHKVLEPAEFPGGLNALSIYLSENLKYPKSVQNQGISGRVYIQFVISEEGFVEDAKVVKSVHTDLDKEALRVVNNMPKWNPGKQHNLFVKVTFTQPINFVLQ